MIFLKLFFEFFKTGLFAIGGGMATIPFLYKMSDATGWFTYNDLANMIAVSESTPGPIGVNMATYVGYITGGNYGGTFTAILGGFIATLGLITPSIIVIFIVISILNSFKDNRYINHAFYGLRPASTALIASAGLGVLLSNLFTANEIQRYFFNWKALILTLILLLLTNFVKKIKSLHPIVFIGFSAVIGVVFSM